MGARCWRRVPQGLTCCPPWPSSSPPTRPRTRTWMACPSRPWSCAATRGPAARTRGRARPCSGTCPSTCRGPTARPRSPSTAHVTRTGARSRAAPCGWATGSSFGTARRADRAAFGENGRQRVMFCCVLGHTHGKGPHVHHQVGAAHRTPAQPNLSPAAFGDVVVALVCFIVQRYFETNTSVLYNLVADIGETADVAASYKSFFTSLCLSLSLCLALSHHLGLCLCVYLSLSVSVSPSVSLSHILPLSLVLLWWATRRFSCFTAPTPHAPRSCATVGAAELAQCSQQKTTRSLPIRNGCLSLCQAANPGVAARLGATLTKWLRDTEAPIPEASAKFAPCLRSHRPGETKPGFFVDAAVMQPMTVDGAAPPRPRMRPCRYAVPSCREVPVGGAPPSLHAYAEATIK